MTTIEELNQREAEELQLVREKYAKLRKMVPHVCEHSVTQYKDGKTGLWCTSCGEKIYDVENRECRDCIYFFSSSGYSGCKKHLMAVNPSMRVTFNVAKGTCFECKHCGAAMPGSEG